MSSPNRGIAPFARQRGAIGLMAALTMGLAMLFMVMVVDSGRLYLEKRSLQRVADMSALEAATRKGNCATGNTAASYASQSAIRNGFIPDVDERVITTSCGTLSVNADDNRRTFVANSTSTQAVQVVVSHPVQRSIAATIASLASDGSPSGKITLSATAVAAAAPPLAQLSIRSVALALNSNQSPLLNLIFSNLLGGSLNLGAVSWEGVINTNLNLLGYLDRLKLDLNLTAVDYNQLLGTNVTLSQLIQSSINLLQTNNTLTTDTQLILTTLKAAVGSATITLGDLVKIQSGTDIAGLTTNLRLVDLLQTLAQVANKKNGITASAQINLAPLAVITTRIQVIEPPQLSAIGDPSKVNPSIPVLSDPNRIYVRTAQTRALISINLPILDVLNNPPVSAVTNLVGNLTPILNSALSLNIVNLIGSLTCLLASPCTVTDLKLLNSSATQGPRIDLSLALAAAESYVTGYTCTSNTNKSLSVRTTATLLSARLGLIDSAAAFPVSTDPAAVVALPLPIVDIGTRKCSILLGLLGTCSARVPFGGGGLGISFNTLNNAIVGTAAGVNSTFSSPNLPEIGASPYYLDSLASVLPSTVLDGLVSGVSVQVYKPPVSNVLGNLITGTGTLLNTVLGLVDNLVENTLKPLLTSLVDPLLNGLGLTLNPADVGANLSCNIGQATLVI